MHAKVAVFTGPRQAMDIREYPLPEVGPEDILVKVRCANICGSDLHIWRGHGPGFPKNMSIVPGHEMVGEVFRLGKNVQTDCLGQSLQEGDRLAHAYFLPCGACPACLHGSSACPHRYRHWMNDVSDPPHFRGAYGEYYYLRKGQTICKVPPELSDTVVSPVNCALCEALYGLDQIGIRLGDTVVIQGAGGLELYATAIAKDMGASQVIVFDKLPARLELAKAFGADPDGKHRAATRETAARVRVRAHAGTGCGCGRRVCWRATGSRRGDSLAAPSWAVFLDREYHAGSALQPRPRYGGPRGTDDPRRDCLRAVGAATSAGFSGAPPARLSVCKDRFTYLPLCRDQHRVPLCERRASHSSVTANVTSILDAVGRIEPVSWQ